MNFAESPFLAGHHGYLFTQPYDYSQAIDFYHSSHGVSLDYNHVNHHYNPNIVSSIPFEPFDEVPYYNENSSQGWKYVPEMEHIRRTMKQAFMSHMEVIIGQMCHKTL